MHAISNCADWSKPVIYLGFGGVLHVGAAMMDRNGNIRLRGGQQTFEYARLLSDLLRPYPSVQIVLSCGWIDTLGETVTSNLLPTDLRKRVVGSTKLFSEGLDGHEEGQRRVLRVLRHARTSGVRRWLALDVTVSAVPFARWKNFLVTRADEALGSINTQRQLQSWLRENATDTPCDAVRRAA
ncbi:HAD domain-containing protein [Caballeronia sp. J97]|uniref:HAD domain-containing protein n=1 Tax=Caballeronia sp. J97 TaxID=2805429 RepID=UPI002AAF8EDA|nr:HAD domain-containing protein [Caballeronia sp. J97]